MKHIHFVGVSGIGMSAVAKIAHASGMIISGSADTANEQTEHLLKRGIRFYLGHRAENVSGADMVVRSAAVPEENAEIREAIQRNIPVYLYSQYLGVLMKGKRGIAVSGTHGKTTTTAMIAQIFYNAGLDPTVVCGGVMNAFTSNSLYGEGKYLISEACEYNRSFLDLEKWYSIVTNIETDHLDYYRGLDDIKEAFSKFLVSTDERGFSVVNGDDKNIKEIIKGINKEVITVGFGNENQFKMYNVKSIQGAYSFRIKNKSDKFLTIHLSVPGRFHCMNGALSAILSLKLGIDRGTIEQALNRFSGTKRRIEYLGRMGGNSVYTDYAHHPTEVKSTLDALGEKYPERKICVVFQPHQYSRTAELFGGFIRALLHADYVFITDIYRQRDADSELGKVKSQDLVDALKKESKNINVKYVENRDKIISLLLDIMDDKLVVVFMGAGDIDDVARHFSAHAC